MGVLTGNNLYAPQWMGVSPVLKGLRDWEYDLDLPPVAVAGAGVGASGFSIGNQLPVDIDADFLVREIQFVVVAASGGVAPGDIRVRLRDGNGRLITTDYVPILDLNGPIVPAWPLIRGSVLLVDYQNTLAASSATVWMVLKGWKRLECGNDGRQAPGSFAGGVYEVRLGAIGQQFVLRQGGPADVGGGEPYVPMYQRYTQPTDENDLEDFEYVFTFTAVAAGDLLKIPLQTDNEADFLWKAISGDWNTANNDVAVVGKIAVAFYDVGGVPLMQRGLINPWGSQNCGQFRESVFSSGGGRPAPFFPEVFIPRGGVVSMDISFGGAGTLRLSLRGQKVYGQCR